MKHKNFPTIKFQELLSEPLRNGIYKKKEFHGSGSKIVNMGELFAYPRLKSNIQMKRVELNANEKAKATLQDGDLIFARRSLTAEGAGKCSIVLSVNEETTFESSIIRARLNTDIANPEFYYYFFSSIYGKLALGTILRQVAVAGITGSDLAQLEVPYPPKALQDKIAEISKDFDEKIELNTQTNQTLESIAQAIFKSWFVDFEPVKAKMAVLAEGGTREQAEMAAMGAISGKSEAELAQLQQQNPEHYQQLAETAALFPSAMVESELGEIPEGWEVGRIGDIALAKGGYAFKSNEFEAKGNKVVKIKNITGDGRVDLTDCDCVKHPQPEKLNRFKITNGDLLMAMTGATVGKIGIAISGNDYVYLNQRVAKFESKIKTQKVSWFLFPCIQQKSVFDTVVGSAQGSAQPNISSAEIERTEIVVPDENLISEYCEFVDAFFKKWMANNILNIELANLRDSLLPKLLSGEILLGDCGESNLISI